MWNHLVVFISFYGRNPFGVRALDVNGILKDIPDRNPIFADTLRTNVLTVDFKQPLLETNKTVIKGGEPLLVVMRHNVFVGDNCGDEKGFVSIDAEAVGICEVYIATPSLKWERGWECAVTQ